MPSPAELALASFETFASQVLSAAVIRDRLPLAIEAFQTEDRVTHAEAVRAKFRRVKMGFEWGPKWSTAWFRLSAKLPSGWRGEALHLRFSTDTEAQLWLGRGRDGVPHQGLDVNRDTSRLPLSATGGASITLHVEAACNHPFGAAGLQWDTPDVQRRWESATPGRLLAAELVKVDDDAWTLLHTYQMAIGLAKELLPPPVPMYSPAQPWAANPPLWQSARSEVLISALRQATTMLVDRGVRAAARTALRVLNDAIEQGPAASAAIGHAIGHAHIDTAWLWPLRETRRKCVRTFSNVLRLMERDAGFTFLCSQAAQYAMVEQDSPALFEQIRTRVRQGRWEPGGGMWIEPDCNVPSGESLIRQAVHGTRYWREQFGDRAPQSLLFLPDTFGFPAQLPQIMRLAGLHTFVTNKMSWNDTHPYPHTTFRWIGLDGSEVLAHMTPGHDYNASNTPRDLVRAERNHRSKQIPAISDRSTTGSGPRFLQPFGFGDGGGGPTEAMILHTRLARESDGLPRMTFSRADEFCRALGQDVASAERAGTPIPTHQGELYLELHRGVQTSQQWLKRANLRAEDDLRTVEFLLAASPAPVKPSDARRACSELDAAWKLVLLNQFHDILPGSSIREVYDDARMQHAQVQGTVAHWRAALLSRWSRGVKTTAATRPGGAVLAINPASVASSGPIVVSDGRRERLIAATVPALSAVVLDARAALDVPPVVVTENTRSRIATLDNGRVRAVVDGLGRVTSLRLVLDGHAGPELVGEAVGRGGAAALGHLVSYEDRPRLWDAWDIDAEHIHLSKDEVAPATNWSVNQSSPLRAEVVVERPLGLRSRVKTTIRLDAASSRVEVTHRVNWHEEHRLLRTLFTVNARTAAAQFGTQMGWLARPTAPDPAAFEVPVQRWMGQAEPGVGGVAVLTGSQYGASVRGQTLGLSLLRSPRYPDPTADIGVHELRYALVAHDHDDPAEIATLASAEAERFARPVIAQSVGAARGSGRTWSPCKLAGAPDGAVIVSALKPAEDGRGVIVRLTEVAGVRHDLMIRWGLAARSVHPTDLHEQPLKMSGVRHRAGAKGDSPMTTLTIAPFQILTLRVL